MTELVSAAEAAEIIGVGVARVKEYMRRGVDPLPTMLVVAGGKKRLVVRAEIQPWVRRQAERDTPAPPRSQRRLAS
jgi:hypothetical protein